jgi:putative ubiquitin-RnfH superfamily antitoxin RatB of RatAB toxin-antitoxin module
MAESLLHVCVTYSPGPRDVREWQLELAVGSTVADALAASPLRSEFTEVDLQAVAVGVWGRKAPVTQLLRDRDRVEVYRPLLVDPKVARRERFRRQGARTAGLFARKR